MSELDYDAKREGLRFSAEVKLLASVAPDAFAAAALRKTGRLLDVHFGFTVHEKKIAIRQYIAKSGGTSSIAELCEHFPWNRAVITHLVGELESENILEFYTSPNAGSFGGRPPRRIRSVKG